ncbi:MAG: hypothetical protein ACYTDX_07930 [Planctomycetota bacterium]|jgi:hypothetical protein
MNQDVPARWVELVTNMEEDGLPSVHEVFVHLMEDGDAHWSITARGCEEVMDTLQFLCGMAGRSVFTPRVIRRTDDVVTGEQCSLVLGVPARISLGDAERFLSEPVVDDLI